MKNLLVLSTLVLTIVLMSGFNSVEGAIKNKKLIGTWNYEAIDAPYQYQKGKIIFVEKNDTLVGYFMIGDYKIDIENIVVAKKNVTFTLELEGETVTFNMNYKKTTMEGTASYYGGSNEIKATKVS